MKLHDLTAEDLRRLANVVEAAGPHVVVGVTVPAEVQAMFMKATLTPKVIVVPTADGFLAIDTKDASQVLYEDLDPLIAVLRRVGRPVALDARGGDQLYNYLADSLEMPVFPMRQKQPITAQDLATVEAEA